MARRPHSVSSLKFFKGASALPRSVSALGSRTAYCRTRKITPAPEGALRNSARKKARSPGTLHIPTIRPGAGPSAGISEAAISRHQGKCRAPTPPRKLPTSGLTQEQRKAGARCRSTCSHSTRHRPLCGAEGEEPAGKNNVAGEFHQRSSRSTRNYDSGRPTTRSLSAGLIAIRLQTPRS